MALMESNVAHNALGATASAATLDWASDSDADALLGGEKPFDLILATDCAYHERLHAPLVATLARCCDPGHPDARAYLGTRHIKLSASQLASSSRARETLSNGFCLFARSSHGARSARRRETRRGAAHRFTCAQA